MQRVRGVAQMSGWAALVVAFFCISTPEMFRRVVKAPVTLAGDTPFHSSDSFFEFVGGPHEGSQPLIAMFNSVPAGRRILILDRPDDPASNLLGMLSAYLAWPHTVEIVDQRLVSSARTVRTFPDLRSAGAIVLCLVPPPASLPPGKRFGNALEFVAVNPNSP